MWIIPSVVYGCLMVLMAKHLILRINRLERWRDSDLQDINSSLKERDSSHEYERLTAIHNLRDAQANLMQVIEEVKNELHTEFDEKIAKARVRSGGAKKPKVRVRSREVHSEEVHSEGVHSVGVHSVGAKK